MSDSTTHKSNLPAIVKDLFSRHKEHIDIIVSEALEKLPPGNQELEWFILVPKNPVVAQGQCATKGSETVKQHQGVVIHFMEGDNRIEAFYYAKKCIDEKNISQLTIECAQTDEAFWRHVHTSYVGKTNRVFMFDIRVSWQGKIDSLQQNESGNSETAVCHSWEQFLSVLPSLEPIETKTSAIIPKDLFYHGFTTRNGGISYMPGMQSLNLTYSNLKRDSSLVILENRKRLAKSQNFDDQHFHMASAIHGKEIHGIDTQNTDPPSDGYDGIVTNVKGVTVAAPGADCITMVFVDPIVKCCGALHSGWMGTVKQAAVAMIGAMVTRYGSKPSDIRVAMGPSIGTCCFEFGADQIQQFKDLCPDSVIWKEGKDKPFIDLHLINRVLLEKAGIASSNIDTSCTQCTVCHPHLYFSYRRDGRPFGNQAAFVGIC